MARVVSGLPPVLRPITPQLATHPANQPESVIRVMEKSRSVLADRGLQRPKMKADVTKRRRTPVRSDTAPPPNYNYYVPQQRRNNYPANWTIDEIQRYDHDMSQMLIMAGVEPNPGPKNLKVKSEQKGKSKSSEGEQIWVPKVVKNNRQSPSPSVTSTRTNSPQSERKNTVECYNCGKEGHFSKGCAQPQKQNKTKNIRKSNTKNNNNNVDKGKDRVDRPSEIASVHKEVEVVVNCEDGSTNVYTVPPAAPAYARKTYANVLEVNDSEEYAARVNRDVQANYFAQRGATALDRAGYIPTPQVVAQVYAAADITKSAYGVEDRSVSNDSGRLYPQGPGCLVLPEDSFSYQELTTPRTGLFSGPIDTVKMILGQKFYYVHKLEVGEELVVRGQGTDRRHLQTKGITLGNYPSEIYRVRYTRSRNGKIDMDRVEIPWYTKLLGLNTPEMDKLDNNEPRHLAVCMGLAYHLLYIKQLKFSNTYEETQTRIVQAACEAAPSFNISVNYAAAGQFVFGDTIEYIQHRILSELERPREIRTSDFSKAVQGSLALGTEQTRSSYRTSLQLRQVWSSTVAALTWIFVLLYVLSLLFQPAATLLEFLYPALIQAAPFLWLTAFVNALVTYHLKRTLSSLLTLWLSLLAIMLNISLHLMDPLILALMPGWLMLIIQLGARLSLALLLTSFRG